MNAAQTIRTALKTELGLNTRRVSVRKARGSSIAVTIRDTAVDFAAVEAIAKRSQRVSRCDYSGDILAGGNTWVTVSHHDDLVEDLTATVEAKLANAPTDGRVIVISPTTEVYFAKNAHPLSAWCALDPVGNQTIARSYAVAPLARAIAVATLRGECRL